MEAAEGCQSYRFYYDEAGAPHCALYAAPVSMALDRLDTDADDCWFDLTCGSPDAEAWHQEMPTDHNGGS